MIEIFLNSLLSLYLWFQVTEIDITYKQGSPKDVEVLTEDSEKLNENVVSGRTRSRAGSNGQAPVVPGLACMDSYLFRRCRIPQESLPWKGSLIGLLCHPPTLEPFTPICKWKLELGCRRGVVPKENTGAIRGIDDG